MLKEQQLYNYSRLTAVLQAYRWETPKLRIANLSRDMVSPHLGTHLSRDLEGKTMPNLSLRLYRQPIRLLPAVFGVTLLCLPPGYAGLRLHVEEGWGDGGERRGRKRLQLTMGRV